MSEWLPIETAPRDGSDILVTTANGMMVVVYWDANYDKRSPNHRWGSGDGPHYLEDLFTHWQPLPDPPESPPQLHPDATGG